MGGIYWVYKDKGKGANKMKHNEITVKLTITEALKVLELTRDWDKTGDLTKGGLWQKVVKVCQAHDDKYGIA